MRIKDRVNCVWFQRSTLQEHSLLSLAGPRGDERSEKFGLCKMGIWASRYDENNNTIEVGEFGLTFIICLLPLQRPLPRFTMARTPYTQHHTSLISRRDRIANNLTPWISSFNMSTRWDMDSTPNSGQLVDRVHMACTVLLRTAEYSSSIPWINAPQPAGRELGASSRVRQVGN